MPIHKASLRTKSLLSVAMIAASLLLTGCDWWGDEESPTSQAEEQTSTLPETVKTAFGADSKKFDTDGDGLSDDFEISHGFPFLRPDRADTDGNGKSDADEDTDGDGLTNIQEQKLKTHPLLSDTDGDGLSDGAELNTYKTDPLKADSDGDGVPDGREIENGTNPLIADATLVITSKKAHTVYQPGTGQFSSVRVDILGEGDLSGKVIVTNRASTNLPFETAHRFDISLPAALNSKMQSATLVLPYNPLTAGAINDTDFVVLTIDPATGFYESLPSVANSGTKTITATTTHFSDFMVVIKSKYDAWLATLPKSCVPITDPGAQAADVVLVIDSSGSMTSNDPANLRLTAARQFIQAMKATDRTAVVDFDGGARAAIGLSSNQTAISTAIGTIDSSGSTNIGAGVSAALNILRTGSDSSKLQAIFLLTDGDGSYDTALTTQAAAVGIRIFTVGLTGAVNDTLLTSIAVGTGGGYKKLADASGLVGLFTEFSQVFGDTGRDTDGDGLTDCQETYGVFVTKLGRFVTSDPNTKNSDTDGIEDGEEVGAVRSVSVPFSTVRVVVGDGESDPRMSDTDGDSLTDDLEYAEDTKPYLADSDGDGLTDLQELNAGTSPTNPDTDRDSVVDSLDENPLVYEEQLSKLAYVGQFAMGYLCPGDFDVCTDTLPKVAGKLANAFTPVVGNIYDVANLVVNTGRMDLVSAGFDLVGVAGTALFPLTGGASDVAANVTKAGRIISKAVTTDADVGKLATKLALKQISRLSAGDEAAILLARASFRNSYDALIARGVSDASIAKLMKRGNVTLDEIRESLRLAKNSTTGKGFLTNWRDAETLVREGRPRWGKNVSPKGTQPRRFPDDFDEVTQFAKEAKTGCEDSGRVLNQVAADLALKSSGTYKSIEWHFFASAASECIGPGAKVRAALVAAGIPFIVHLP